LGRFGGNPLSLVMGWKGTFTKPWRFSKRRKTVAIRFRWIWVGKLLAAGSHHQKPFCRNPLSLDMGWKAQSFACTNFMCFTSQSAFAGYGLEINRLCFPLPPFFVAIRFRWIWVGNSREHLTWF